MAGLARDTRGSTLVEFALVAGGAALLLLGIIQIGAALMARAEVSHALGQAVRRVYIQPDITAAALEQEVRARLPQSRAADLEVAIEAIQGVRALRVVARFPIELSIPFVAARQVTMRVEAVTPAIQPQR